SLRRRLSHMKSGRGKAGSRGEVWVAVGFGLFRGGFGDAINLAQPATQVDLPAAPGTEGEVRPFSRVSPDFPVANRAACLFHRLPSPQTCGHAPASAPHYFFPFSGFAGAAGFAGPLSLAVALPSLFAGLAGPAAAGFADSDSAFAADLYDSLR